MSEFKKLRTAREAKEKQRSYISDGSRKELATTTQHSQGPSTADKQPSSSLSSDASTIGTQEGFYAAWSRNSFEVCKSVRDPARGRGVFALQAFKPGDILAVVHPSISTLSIANLSKYCSACFSHGEDQLKKCTSCKTVYYCGTECQSRDWSQHKPECAAMQLWMKEAPSPDVAVPSDAVRCLGRLLWRMKKSGNESIFCKEMNAMQSNRTSLQPSSYELNIHLANALAFYLGFSSPDEMVPYGMTSVVDLVDLLSRFTTNTIALTTPSLTPIGACISPSIALLNHSCDPNVMLVFPRASTKSKEPLLHVVALKPINLGDELLTSYIDTTLPCEERQKSLKETYFFQCDCALCAPSPSIQNIDPRKAMWCPTQKDSLSGKCDGLCRIPKEEETTSCCTTCGASINAALASEIRDAVVVAQEGLTKATELQYKDPKRALRLTLNLISILTSAGLAPGAHPLLGLSRLHSAMLIENLPDFSTVFGSTTSLPTPMAQPESTGVHITPIRQTSSEQRTVEVQSPETKKLAEEAQEALDGAIRAASRTSTGLACVLTLGHPMRGLALAELGKLLSVDEPVPKFLASSKQVTQNNGKGIYPPSGPARLRLARDTLLRARLELMVGFGGASEGGEVGKELRDLLVRIEKELEVWKVGMEGTLS